MNAKIKAGPLRELPLDDDMPERTATEPLAQPVIKTA